MGQQVHPNINRTPKQISRGRKLESEFQERPIRGLNASGLRSIMLNYWPVWDASVKKFMIKHLTP
jgi:hypothetical protein